MNNYYANFRPGSDPEGHFRTPTLTISDKTDTNRRKLRNHVCAYCSHYTFPAYPVVLDIINDDTGETVESWKLTNPDAKWKRIHPKQTPDNATQESIPVR